MAKFSLITPLDQPIGRRRLLSELKAALSTSNFDHLKIVVAFAKVGPLLRLKPLLDSWRESGGKIEAVFGVDHQGTSAQALTFALTHFDSTYVTQEQNITFHPKMYLLTGSGAALFFVGSNNLTVGGTETNFESAIRFDFDLPADGPMLAAFQSAWDELLPHSCVATKVLDVTLLDQLILDGVVPDETTTRTSAGAGGGKTAGPKSGLKVKPPSALPAKKAVKVGVSTPVLPATPAIKGSIVAVDPYSAQGLAIQIKPHHNGEIFLSVGAALQNPAFFKWPFNGLTVPKKPGNPAYPQLVPDPVVDILVVGAAGKSVLVLNGYNLNTIYYDKKSEIRVTASPLVGVVPDYSVMIIEKGNKPGLDYDIVIHRPDSPDYAAWVAACNQQMPGGGSTPRKFGWF